MRFGIKLKFDTPLSSSMRLRIRAVFVGKGRLYNRRFLQMCSHYLVDPVACPR